MMHQNKVSKLTQNRGWGISPLLLGWGTGPDENQNPTVFGFALLWLLIFPAVWRQADFWSPKFGRWNKKYTSRCSTGRPNPCDDHIYHFHASEWLNGIFSFCKGKIQQNAYTSRFSAGRPNPCNDHIYHFQASESLNIILCTLKVGEVVIITCIFI